MPRRFPTTCQRAFHWIAGILLSIVLRSELADASSFSIVYSGRLTHADGSPVDGPATIQVKFWNATEGGTQIGHTLDYSGLNLNFGVFSLEVPFNAEDVAAVFGDGSYPVYIEITAENKTYPREQFSYVPFAMRVPVDAKTLAFDEDGKLSLALTTTPGTNQFLTKSADGKLAWGTPASATIQNQSIAPGTPISGQVLTYNGSQWISSYPTSTLAVADGGTGATSFANNGVLIGAGNLPISTAKGSQYQVLTAGAGGTLGFGALDLSQSAAVSGVLATARGGTGINSAATFPSSGVVVTRDASETLTNKTITAAAINGASTISGSTVINTTGTLASGAATVSGNITLAGNGTTASKLILNDKDSTNSLALKAPDALALSVTWELPPNDGSNGQVLATNGSGTLGWVSGLAPTGAAGGDLTGAFPNPTLADVMTAGAYSKVGVDSKGRVTSGSTLDPADIPNLSATQITSGTLNSAQLPIAGTAGTYAKVSTDVYGRVAAGTTLSASDLPPHSAELINSGTLNTAQLPTAGTAGTYAKVTTDAYGRVTAGTTLASSDITSSLGFTPLNLAGDTMSGALNLGSNDVLSAGNIQMAASKTLALSGNTADPTGLVSDDKGKTWFNTTSNQIKYWDGSSAQVVGAVGASLASLNGQTGATQTFATPGTTGTAPAWSSNANAHTLNIPLASTASVTAGLISNSDYNTFNGKVAGVTSGTGVTVSTTGNIATVNLANAGTAGTYAKVTTDAYGRVTAGTTLSASDLPPLPASLITSGTLNTAQLPTAGTAGTYTKVTTDAYGRVTAGTTLASSDITSSLGFTPINKAGDTMSGALNLGSNDVLSAGNIQMAASKTLALSGNTADPTGLVSDDKGKTWFNTTSNQIKYWDGSAAQVVGAVGASLASLNGQTGATQTFATPGTTGTAPAWSSNANAHTLNIPLASTASVTAGLISNSDYNTFNGKVAGVTSGTGVTVSTTGNIATVNLATAGSAGTYAKVTTDAYGRVTAGTTLASSDITSSLGFTPINKAGDTMSGALVLPANGLVAGTNQLVLANSNVGIGTTAPTSTLDVQKSFGGGMPATTGTSEPNAIMRLRSDGGATLDWGMIATGSAWIQPRYYTNLATNLNLLLNPNGGNVGIGTTTPAGILHIAGTTTIHGAGEGATPSAATIRGANGSGTDINGASLTIQAGLGSGTGTSGSLVFQTAGASGTVAGTTTANTAATRMTITPAGNVGIGSTAPGVKLQVNGQIATPPNIQATGATVDFNLSNVAILQSVGGTAITVSNMADGGVYMVIVSDATSRTYTFTGCTNTHFTPANGATTASLRTVYTILKTTESAATHCYISWVTGI